jgi:Flp pilus assembly protein protease CpaA
MDLIDLVIAGILVLTLIIASLFDLRYRAIPRGVWLMTWFIAIPLAVWRWTEFFMINRPTAILNIGLVGLVIIFAFFLHEFRQFNYGDFIGIAVVFLCLSSGVYPLYVLFYTGLWMMIAGGSVMVIGKSMQNIPYIVPLTMGVITALSLYRY